MQTHLKGFGLENFRVFKDYTWFDFAPITILTGPNSSGKSSLNKALMLMKDNLKKERYYRRSFHSQYSVLDDLSINFSGPDHQLSSGIHSINKDTSNPYLSFCFHNGDYEFPLFIKISHLVRLPTKTQEHRLNSKTYSVEILTQEGLPIFRLQRSSVDPSLFFDIPLLLRIIPTVIDNLNQEIKGYAERDDEFEKQYEDLNLSKDENLTKNPFVEEIKTSLAILETFQNLFSFIDWQSKEVNLKTFFRDNGPFSELHNAIASYEDYHIWYEDVSLSSFLKKISNDIRNQIGFLLFQNNACGDLIKNGSLSKFFDDNTQEIIDNLMDVISIIFGNFDDKKKKDVVNFNLPFLQKTYYLPSIKGSNERTYRSNDDHILNKLFKEYIESYQQGGNGSGKLFYNKWFEKFGLNSLSLERDERLDTNFFTFNGLSNVDLGYGMTQIIAVILRILTVTISIEDDNNFSKFESRCIIILEEPEANLHPKYQSMLADMIAEAAETFEIQFIIETHSEYLLRKLQYLTAKKEVKPEDSVIYYFHDLNNIPKGEKQVKKIEILEDGSLSDDFGPGFFDEAANWQLELIRLKNAKNRSN